MPRSSAMNQAAETTATGKPSRPRTHRVRAWVLVAWLGSGPLLADSLATTDADLEPFARMGQALGSLSYEGILVYSHDNRMETLRIQHRVVDGRVQAVLESLNGEPRVIQQDGSQVVCRLSGEHLIAVAQRALGQQTAEGKPITAQDLAPHYSVQSQGQTRVAGRPTQILAILPTDQLRYGYRFFLDNQTGLPLKLEVLDGSAGTIEQIMFTSLTLNPTDSSPAVLAPSNPAAEALAAEATAPAATLMPAPDKPDALGTAPPNGWTFQGLPPGFRLVLRERIADSAGSPMEHFVLSDGLATISVYVESGPQEGLSGGSRMGAVHAQGGKIAGHQVTVVGEVPALTVAAVLQAVRHGQGDG